MKNKEKYADEILNAFVHTEKNCGFRKKYVLKNDICDNIDCRKCNKLTEEWLEAEYITPKTRQSEFLEMFPTARVNNNTKILEICPQGLNTNFKCPCRNNHEIDCSECYEYYWSEEIE